ncbi:hypothetical protein [Trichothermofontia sp.]
MFAVLESGLPNLALSQQLQVAGVVFERLAGVIQQRCWARLGELQASLQQLHDEVNEAGPVMPPGFPELKLPLVAVWIGVLLGGFNLEQRADFYDAATVWVSPLVPRSPSNLSGRVLSIN